MNKVTFIGSIANSEKELSNKEIKVNFDNGKRLHKLYMQDRKLYKEYVTEMNAMNVLTVSNATDRRKFYTSFAQLVNSNDAIYERMQELKFTKLTELRRLTNAILTDIFTNDNYFETVKNYTVEQCNSFIKGINSYNLSIDESIAKNADFKKFEEELNALLLNADESNEEKIEEATVPQFDANKKAFEVLRFILNITDVELTNNLQAMNNDDIIELIASQFEKVNS